MLSLHVHKMSLTIWLLTKESLKCNNNNNKTWCSNDMSVNIYSHWIIMNSLWTGERGSWTAAKRTIEFVFDPDFFSIHFSLCRVVSISRLNGMLAECYQFACRDGRQQSPCFSTQKKKWIHSDLLSHLFLLFFIHSSNVAILSAWMTQLMTVTALCALALFHTATQNKPPINQQKKLKKIYSTK